MKTIMTLIAVALLSTASMAQNNANVATDPLMASPRPNTVQALPHYWCAECDFSSVKAGECPNHKAALVKEGMYYCKGDEKNATVVAGKCADGIPMLQMSRAEKAKVRMNNNRRMENGKPAEEKK